MIARIVKIIALVIATPIVLLVLGVVYFVVTTDIDYRNAEITTALVRDGIYKPPPQFKFDRACLFSPETFFLIEAMMKWIQYSFPTPLPIGRSC
jgi:hypothetical protein